MVTYPDNIYEPRNFENLPGLNRLTADKKNLYAEDLNETNAEIVAIETILGKNPNGAYASVKAWLEALASGGGGGTWGTITGTLNDQLDLASALSDKENVSNKKTSFQATPTDDAYVSEKLVKDSLDAKANANNVLALDNTTAFTPDNDYEPATKKYVDDNAGGNMPSLNVFTSSGTYYPSSGVKYIEVELVGGGGGGGKGSGTSSGDRGGSGGGAGGYAKKIISVDDLGESETITIGSGGAGAASTSAGGTGGTTYFGSILSASGGGGGQYGGLAPGAGGSGIGGDINIGGEDGNYGNTLGHSGNGGLSFLGLLGAGGDGGFKNGNGLVGKSGIVIIKEFF